MSIKKVRFKIGDKVLTRSKNDCDFKFRDEALKKRTPSELLVQSILEKSFKINEDFLVEHIFQFRRFDFYFPLIKTALEIDEKYHVTPFQKEYDAKVDRYLKRSYQIRTIRLKNELVDDQLSFILSELNNNINQKKNNSDVKKIGYLNVGLRKKENKHKKFKLRNNDKKKNKLSRENKKLDIISKNFKPKSILRKKDI